MSFLIGIIIVVTSFLALYWVFYGQRKYNEMLMPKKKHKLKAILFDMQEGLEKFLEEKLQIKPK